MNSVASPAPSAKPAFAGVFAHLAPHMAELDRFLHGQLASFEPEIRAMADYCIDTSGKRIRPALVFLSGWRGPGVILPDLVRVAAVVELVHLATLVHDDIMDEADVRRSRRAPLRASSARWLRCCSVMRSSPTRSISPPSFPRPRSAPPSLESTRRVCAGEIVQTLRRGSLNITLADYQRIIDLKTAELFRVSCFLGAKLSGAEPACVEAAACFGRHLGIAYQIYDDLADYFGNEARIGKTLGTDLASGKLTLPLITLSERLPADERQTLTEEITGKRPPQLSLRLQQMNDLGVFAAVNAAVHAELTTATAALAPWPNYPATPHLLALGDVLRTQVAALQISG